METLPDILKASLGHLQKRAQEQTDLMHRVETILPSYIMDHCKMGNVDKANGTITLLLDNACWLLKCRHLSPKILKNLNQEKNRWHTINWRICPKDKLQATLK